MQSSGLLTWEVVAESVADSSAYDVPKVVPFNMGFGLNIDDGADVTVQFSFDGANFFDHPYAVAQTADMAGNIAFPVRSIRLRFNAPGRCVLSALIPGIIDQSKTEIIGSA